VSTERILDAFDAGSLHGIGQLFVIFLVDLDDHVAFVVFDLLERNAADNAVAQRLDFDAGFRESVRRKFRRPYRSRNSLMITSCATSTRRRVR